MPLCLDPRGFLNGHRMQVHGDCITGIDVAAWSYGVGIFVRVYSLSWYFALAVFTAGRHGGILEYRNLEILIFFEQWAGHRLLSLEGYQAPCSA